MENATGKEWNCTEKSKEEEQGMSSQPSTSFAKTSAKGTKRKKSVEGDKDSHPKEKARDTESTKPREKITIPPLPDQLPPVTLIHRDILRAWCQKLKLSTKGQKLDAYKRLWEHVYPGQTPCLQDIPNTAKEARIKKPSQRKPKAGKRGMSLKSSMERVCSEGLNVPELASIPQEHLQAAFDEPPALYEEVSTTVVTTSAPEAMLASWARIAASAGRIEGEESESPPEAYGDRWCVVHGRSLPADTDGWVQLQFHAGQAWVPEKKGRVSALFLLPACTFPPPHLEDNMLCPKCVHRNKILIKSLQ